MNRAKALHNGSDANLLCIFSVIVKGFYNIKGEYEIYFCLPAFLSTVVIIHRDS